MAERDKDYDRFHAEWKPRLKLKDREIAESYMRASDPAWDRVRPEEVPHIEGENDIIIIMGDASLTASIRPTDIDPMVREWEHQLQGRQEEPRAFTRKLIAQHMVLNKHGGDDGEMLVCAAVWLTVTRPGAEEITQSLRRGDFLIQYEILFDDDRQESRFRLSGGDLR